MPRWLSAAVLGAALCGCGATASSTTGALGAGSSGGTLHPTSTGSPSSSAGSSASGSTASTGSPTSGSSTAGASSGGASSGGTGSGVVCPGFGDYCGQDGVQNGAPNTLYHCDGAGGPPTGQERCAAGCQVNPAGTADVCNAPGSTSGSSGSGGTTGFTGQPVCPGVGAYCGQDGVHGIPDTLYQCAAAGEPPSSGTACAQGCNTQPDGSADFCNGSAVICPGQGAYCGQDRVQGGATGTLYQCPGLGLAPGSSRACAGGCHVEPEGTPDFCDDASPLCQAAEPGAYCGNDMMVNADANTLYQCPGANQAPTSVLSCASGCQTAAQGTPDYCSSARPTCQGALAGNYCGGDSVSGGDPGTLYHCPGPGQPPDSAVPCGGACSVQPSGTDDVCGLTCLGSLPGYYCGSDSIAGGDPGTLYHCPGPNQPPDAQQRCASGCSIQPSGTEDSCNAACGGASGAALQYEAGKIAAGVGGTCSGVPPSCYSNYCLGLVNDGFKSAGDVMPELAVYSAVDSLHAFQQSNNFNAWNGSCPCGAILFWDANACNGNDGHVAICNGDGTVSTSGWQNYAGSTRAGIDWLVTQECGAAPAGYALPY